MRTCFMLPGILGTTMNTPDNPDFPGVLWVNAGRIGYNHEFGGLALDANGADPHPRWGQRCVPDSAIDSFLGRSYYGPLYRSLVRGLQPRGYSVVSWGYDWRKSIPVAGDRLAATIRERATPADPCSIVAHSQGGLVARWAWVALGLTGEQSLIRRIVTLGTPHRGSYGAVRVWSLDNEEIEQVFMLGVVAPYGVVLNWWFPPFNTPSVLDLVRVAATWPSMYQLMPLVDSDSAQYDPRRPELFDMDNWPAERQLSSVHLSRSFNDWQSFLRHPSSTPPAEVLTTVAGTGQPTAWRLGPGAQIGSRNAYASTEYGDGTVPMNSALVIPGNGIVVAGDHAGLPSHPIVLQRIGELVLMNNPTPPPAAPSADLTEQALPKAGPPIPSPSFGSFPQRDCRDGSCYC